MGALWLYADHQELKNFEICHLNVEKSDTTLPCTLPAEVSTHRKINLDHTLQSLETQQVFNELCEQYDIFLLCRGDIGHTKLLSMDIDAGDHPPITQKPYTLPLKHTQWVFEELEILEKGGIMSKAVSPWSRPIVVVPKKAQSGKLPQKCIYVDY